MFLKKAVSILLGGVLVSLLFFALYQITKPSYVVYYEKMKIGLENDEASIGQRVILNDKKVLLTGVIGHHYESDRIAFITLEGIYLYDGNTLSKKEHESVLNIGEHSGLNVEERSLVKEVFSKSLEKTYDRAVLAKSKRILPADLYPFFFSETRNRLYDLHKKEEVTGVKSLYVDDENLYIYGGASFTKIHLKDKTVWQLTNSSLNIHNGKGIIYKEGVPDSLVDENASKLHKEGYVRVSVFSDFSEEDRKTFNRLYESSRQQ